MKLTVTFDVNNCYECPFCKYISIQGFSSDICRIDKNPYACTPKQGIKKDCPCLKNKEGIFKFYQ